MTRRNKSELKYYGMAAAFVVVAALFAVYFTTPAGVRASPEIYAYGELRVAYTDGSVERIVSPKTPLEKTAVSLQDFFKGLSALERGGKAVDRIQAIVWLESTGMTPAVAKSYITATAGGAPLYATSTEKKAYFLEANKPVELWARTWAASEIAAKMPEGDGDLVVRADVYTAALDGVYHAAIELKASLTKPAAAGQQPGVEVEAGGITAKSDQSGGPVQPAGAGNIPTAQGMTHQEYVSAVESITGNPFTTRVTVTVDPAGYQPDPGTLAAQDQYAYDVTNFWVTYRETGKIPDGWIIGKDQLGQTVVTSPNGYSMHGDFAIGE